jgi:hypothetical protein
MKDEIVISDKKLAKLAKWDLVESLFHAHTKVKAVHVHLIDEINYTYRIA